MDRDLAITIAGMAAILGATRIAGYILIGRITPSPLLDAWLEYIPGATLVALVVPMLVREGPVGVLAGLAVWLIAVRRGDIVLAMLAGVAIVALLGALLG